MAIQGKSQPLKVGSLKLDPQNTRIPMHGRSDDQRVLLHELLKSEDIKQLAASIAKLGIFPSERLVVMPDGRHFIVLEGNRRLAAVKLLINPELAPTQADVRYFKSLSNRIDISSISKLDVFTVPDRASAAPIIAQLHTQLPKKRWTALQQAVFYREMADEGQSPSEIADLTGKTESEIRGFLRQELLHRMSLQCDLPKDIEEKVDNSKFPLSTLDRFLNSKAARKFMGLEYDDDSGLTGKIHPDRFKAVIKQIVTDIVTVESFTRKVNSEKDFEKYIEEAERKLPETKIRGKFVPEEILGLPTGNGDKTQPAPPKPKPPRPDPKSKSIIPRGFVCSSKHVKVSEIFNELKKMELSTKRNTTGVMLRVLIELALWSYIKDQNIVDEVIDHFDKDGKKRKYAQDWIPPLRDLISYMVDKGKFAGMTADERRSVRSLGSKDADYIITIEGFNKIVHNPNIIPLESDLRALWTRAEPLLRITLA